MAEVFIEQDEDGWRAKRNKRTVSRGDTQANLGEEMHDRFPKDVIFGERVRRGDDDLPKPNKWRVLHQPTE
jgi:hypothetical protein